jgi:folate-binding protein YgfZ
VEIEKTNLKVFGTFHLGFGIFWGDRFASPNKTSVSYNSHRRKFDYFESVSAEPPKLKRAGLAAFHALRLYAGRPEITDIDDRSLPHEFDWLYSAVHLSKGCYRGQESVAKVHNLGHPPRRIALLTPNSGDELATPGDRVFYLDKEVGKVVASAIHFEAGSIALALLNRTTPYLDLQIEMNGQKRPCTQEVLVPADAGKAANLPRPSAFKLTKRT